MAPRYSLGLAALLVACTGGGGALSNEIQTQDTAPSSLDRASTSTERAGSSTDVASKTNELDNSGEPATGSGGFSCAGTYRCGLDGYNETSLVVLNGGAGGCTANGSGLNADGTLTKDGKVVATWHSTPGGGFTYSTSVDSERDGGTSTTITITCSKVSDSTAPVDNGDGTPSVTVDGGR